MNPRNTVVSMFVLTACVLTCACTTVDRFTIRDVSVGPIENRQLVLKEPCHYDAGLDIDGNLSPGPLQPDAIGVPLPSNAHIKETIYLIQVDDLPVPGAKGGYDIESFIGVRRDGALVPDISCIQTSPGQARWQAKMPGSASHRKIVTIRWKRPIDRPESQPEVRFAPSPRAMVRPVACRSEWTGKGSTLFEPNKEGSWR